jgi:hypothetical protein
MMKGRKMKKNASIKMHGRIIATSDDLITIKFSKDVSSYRNGQFVVIGIPHERKTARGNVVNVAEIIAHGEISSVSDDVVAIKSKRSNPVISDTALRDNYGKDCLMIVDVLH